MLTVIRNEDEMREALRRRRRQLALTQEEAEHRIGLTRGHLGKVENGNRRWGKRPFSMTYTLECMLSLYGLRLVLVEGDDEIIDLLDRLARERIGRPAIVASSRRPRCPNTGDLFERRRVA